MTGLVSVGRDLESAGATTVCEGRASHATLLYISCETFSGETNLQQYHRRQAVMFRPALLSHTISRHCAAVLNMPLHPPFLSLTS